MVAESQGIGLQSRANLQQGQRVSCWREMKKLSEVGTLAVDSTRNTVSRCRFSQPMKVGTVIKGLFLLLP